MFRLADGKIAEHTMTMDDLSFLQPLQEDGEGTQRGRPGRLRRIARLVRHLGEALGHGAGGA